MINELNIDDIIRDEKNKLRKDRKNIQDYFILWGKDGYKILREFFMAVMPCSHGWFCLCGNGDKFVDKWFKQGIVFMGIKHKWDKRRTGFKIIKDGRKFQSKTYGNDDPRRPQT